MINNHILQSAAVELTGKHFIIAGFEIREVMINGEKRTSIQVTYIEDKEQIIFLPLEQLKKHRENLVEFTDFDGTITDVKG